MNEFDPIDICPLRARNVSLIDASKDALKELSEMGKLLAETEKLKDSMQAEIAKTRTLIDIHRVSTKVGNL